MGERWPEASCAASPSAFLGCCGSATAAVAVAVGAIVDSKASSVRDRASTVDCRGRKRQSVMRCAGSIGAAGFMLTPDGRENREVAGRDRVSAAVAWLGTKSRTLSCTALLEYNKRWLY